MGSQPAQGQGPRLLLKKPKECVLGKSIYSQVPGCHFFLGTDIGKWEESAFDSLRERRFIKHGWEQQKVPLVILPEKKCTEWSLENLSKAKCSVGCCFFF